MFSTFIEKYNEMKIALIQTDLFWQNASKNREKAGFSVPAHGLYLTKIYYDYL